MRLLRPLVALTTLGLLLGAVGCAREVTGTPAAPAPAPLALSEDGYGIVAGFGDAPARIEIYTEPQCSHCADLQREFGDRLAYHVAIGDLQVTYRPLTFLDDDYDGYSSTVANALFAAAEAIDDSAATGTQFQRFVEQLWVNQDPGGQPFSGDELRTMAVDAGIPERVADHLAGPQEAVDIVDMENTNFDLLFEVDQINTGTPTVYDLDAGQKVDLAEDWLDELVGS